MQICQKTNKQVDYGLCAELCTKKCHAITANGVGREIGKMHKAIAKHGMAGLKRRRLIRNRRKK